MVSCLSDDVEQVLWQGETSHPTARKIGIKQGCPLSPFIFNIMMDAVLSSVEEEIGIFQLNQECRISLPIILVYADDIIVIVENIEDLERILASLQKHLSSVGLHLNESKCQVLVRNPLEEPPDEIEILGKKYKVQRSIKYLGIHITSRLDRPLTVRARCRNTVRVSKVVMDFLRKRNPSWELGRLIYETVLAPAMLYGTQTAVLTKYSRTSLRNYERQIVREMASLCYHEDEDGRDMRRSVDVLLKRRRITKKVRAHQMRFWGHVMRRPRNNTLRAASNLSARRLRPCRPSFTWWDSIISNMKRYGDLSYAEWEELSGNKVKLHKKIEDIYTKQESTDESDLNT